MKWKVVLDSEEIIFHFNRNSHIQACHMLSLSKLNN